MVKDLRVEIIDSSSANAFIRRFHYSGKVVNNSKIHFGVMQAGALRGVMSFGCPMDKNKAIRLVRNTKWGGMLELNRMAFAPELPKNAESRCLAYALRYIKKNYSQVKWIQTYADACQCGDGTIYRAVGFLLINVKKNSTLRRLENGRIVADKSLRNYRIDGKYLSELAFSTALPGFQIKYIYFLDPEKRKDLTCAVLDYSEIDRRGAGMYKGKSRASSSVAERRPLQGDDGGAIPTDALQ